MINWKLFPYLIWQIIVVLTSRRCSHQFWRRRCRINTTPSPRPWDLVPILFMNKKSTGFPSPPFFYIFFCYFFFYIFLYFLQNFNGNHRFLHIYRYLQAHLLLYYLFSFFSFFSLFRGEDPSTSRYCQSGTKSFKIDPFATITCQ